MPVGELWQQALAEWRTLRSDDDAVFDRQLTIDCSDLEPKPGHQPDQACH